jgi:hypothetical protein
MARSARRTGSTAPTYVVSVVIVECSCGMFPLDKATHRDAASAWQAAAAHAALNPDKCRPNMFRDDVPAGLAAAI